MIATTGGALGGGGTIGTSTVAAVENGTRTPSPTTNEKVKVCGKVTSGATNVGLAAVRLLSATGGSLGLMTWVQVNGPVGGVLAVPLKVTVTPAYGGFGVELNVGRATEVNVPGMQVGAGVVGIGNGAS